ncbi:unnamed protein product [Closterium sp. NIES-53]
MAPTGAKNVSAGTNTPRPPTPSIPLTKLLSRRGLTGTRLLLALAATKAFTLRGSTSTSNTAAATSTTAAAASTTPTAATEAPTPVAVVVGARALWGSRVVEALTIRPTPSRPPQPGT